MRRVVWAAVGVLLAVAAIWTRTHTPDDYDHRYAPLATEGQIEKPVTAGNFTVRVEGVATARSVRSRMGHVVRPDGLFLIVTASATTRHDPLQLWTALLRTRDGREFRETVKEVTAKGTDTLDAVALGPGVWTRGVFVFEVLADRLADAELLLSDRSANEKDPPEGFPPFGFELTAQANISLGIDHARERRLGADAQEDIIVRGAPA